MQRKFERRRQQRIIIRGYTAYINDGKSTYHAVVQDVSLTGVRLSNLSINFIMKRKPYNILILNKRNKKTCILARYRWIKRRGHLVEMGFYVTNSLKGWVNLVKRKGDKK